MKIDLKYPFSGKWKKGYLVTNKEPRRNVILYNSDSDRTTISYARYLMSVHLGRFLEKSEQVDHINHNKIDDRIDNYQILTLQENRAKEVARKGRLRSLIKCPVCEETFSIRKGNSQAVDCNKGKVSCCSKICSNTFKTLNLSEDERLRISQNTLISVYRDHTNYNE
jgi:HNH endonuclease